MIPVQPEFEPGALVVIVGPRNKLGRHVVTTRHCGVSHTDTIDTDNAHERQRYREKVVNRFDLPDESHEWLEQQIESKAKAVDSKSSAEIFKPVITMLDTVAPTKVDWLVKDKIAIGKNNLWAGVPGVGKSLAALAIGASESSGRAFFGAKEKSREPGGVVILTMEDDAADTIVPRLIAHGADLSRVALVQGLTEVDGDGKTIHGIDLLHDIGMVIEAIKQVENCRLVIIDTISDYITGKTDSHKNADTRAVLNPLARMASDYRVANLLISHLRKTESSSAVNSVMGSIAFVGQCRVAWAITRCPTNPRRRLMTAIKNNLAQDTSGLAFQIDPWTDDPEIPVVAWEGEPIRMNADQAMAQLQQPRGRKPVEREDAADWLARYLADGPQPASEVLANAEVEQYNRRTVQRAFEQLECKRRKAGFRDGWIWSLPQDDTDDQTLANSHPGNLRINHEENNKRERHISILPARVTDCERGVVDAFNDELANCNGHSDDVPF